MVLGTLSLSITRWLRAIVINVRELTFRALGTVSVSTAAAVAIHLYECQAGRKIERKEKHTKGDSEVSSFG